MITIRELLNDELTSNKANLNIGTIEKISSIFGNDPIKAKRAEVILAFILEACHIARGRSRPNPTRPFPFIRDQILGYLEADLETGIDHIIFNDGTSAARNASVAGMAVGDAGGAFNEFEPWVANPEGPLDPKKMMKAGGFFKSRKKGQHTDDTATGIVLMTAIALAKMRDGRDAPFPSALAKSLMVLWNINGFASGDTAGFGLGGSMSSALYAWEDLIEIIQTDHHNHTTIVEMVKKLDLNDLALSLTASFNHRLGLTSEGNGCLMRLAGAVSMASSLEQALDYAWYSAKITTGGPDVADLCRLFAYFMYRGFQLNAEPQKSPSHAGDSTAERFIKVRKLLFGQQYGEEMKKFTALVANSKIVAPKRPTDLLVELMKTERFQDTNEARWRFKKPRPDGSNANFWGASYRAKLLTKKKITHGGVDGSDFFPLHEDELVLPSGEKAIWRPSNLTENVQAIIKCDASGAELTMDVNWKGKEYKPNNKTLEGNAGYYLSYAVDAAIRTLQALFNIEDPEHGLQFIVAQCGDSDTAAAIYYQVATAMSGGGKRSPVQEEWHQAVFSHPLNRCVFEDTVESKFFFSLMKKSVPRARLLPGRRFDMILGAVTGDDSDLMYAAIEDARIHHTEADDIKCFLDLLKESIQTKRICLYENAAIDYEKIFTAKHAGNYEIIKALMGMAGAMGIDIEGVYQAEMVAIGENLVKSELLATYENHFARAIGLHADEEALIYIARHGELCIKFAYTNKAITYKNSLGSTPMRQRAGYREEGMQMYLQAPIVQYLPTPLPTKIVFGKTYAVKINDAKISELREVVTDRRPEVTGSSSVEFWANHAGMTSPEMEEICSKPNTRVSDEVSVQAAYEAGKIAGSRAAKMTP